MNKCLQNLLATYYDDMIFSLSIEGIDLHTANWNTEIINQNAYKSAGILIEVASRHMECRDAFLQTIIMGCRRESTMMDTMEMICEVFEHINALPPLGIIQHTLHPELLKIYCADLATWLKKYLQNSPDCVSLHPGFMMESLKWRTMGEYK